MPKQMALEAIAKWGVRPSQAGLLRHQAAMHMSNGTVTDLIRVHLLCSEYNVRLTPISHVQLEMITNGRRES